MSFDYATTLELTRMMIQEQLRKSESKDDEVLNIPIIMGPVGIGKTSLFRQIADEYGLRMLRINCGDNSDPTDISGMPVPSMMTKTKDGKDGYMKHALNETLWTACEEPVMLFFDDIDKMPSIVEGALVGLYGERQSRNRHLHEGTIIVGAGNRLQDDRLAHQLSESVKTRGTIIEMMPNLKDFFAYAEKQREANSAKQIHPALLGYLQYRPAHLHQPKDDVPRFPTPRGYAEVSPYLFRHEDAHQKIGKNYIWHMMIGLKLGEHIANDFWAWYTVVSAVDVQKIFTEGKLEAKNLKETTERSMLEYAAVFAVAQHLNTSNPTKAVWRTWAPFEDFVRDLSPEMRIALLIQLNDAAKRGVKENLPKVGSMLLEHIIEI